MIQELYVPMLNTATAVLVVDQDPKSREMLVELCEELDVDIIEADCGLEALRMLRILGPGFFKFVFIDLDMPDVSGEEIMVSLKKADPQMMGILCTEDVYHPVAKFNHQEYGFMDVIRKPFDKRVLREVLPYILDLAHS